MNATLAVVLIALAPALTAAPPALNAAPVAATMAAPAPAAVLPTAAPAAGVVALVAGSVSAGLDSSREVTAGVVLREGDTVETGADAWAEVRLRGDARIRLSARTRVELAQGRLRLVAGRMWLESRTAGLRVVVGSLVATLTDPTSLVVERMPGAAGSIAVGAGRISIGGVRVRAGELASVADDGPRVRSGGRAIHELVAAEARTRRGDLIGMERFLIRRVAEAAVARLPPRGIADLMRLDAEVMGADQGHVGFAVESAVRPPAFFEEEVPPKGPNVRVEVQFSGE